MLPPRAETYSFSLYHDVTIKNVGRSTYVNVVRAGSKVSNPSAVCLDTGEALKVDTLKGDEITKAKIDIGEPVKPKSEAVVVRFIPAAAGMTTLQSHPRDLHRPEGWALEGSAFPARITLTDDNRIRLDFTNPRNDQVRALILARRR